MDKNLDIVAKELFEKIRTQFPSVKLGDFESQVTSNPEEARFFEFEFVKGPVDLGTISISLAEDTGIAIMFSNDIVSDADDVTKRHWFNFLREMREFAKQRMLNFDTRDVAKSNLEKRDYETMSTMNGAGQMTESKLWGTVKTSFQNIGEARVVIRHSQPVNAEVPAGRARHIESIYIENAVGERFKYPFKHLNGARAMARHVSNGGNPYDAIGEHLVSLSEELGKLRMFKGYVERNDMVSEAMTSISPRVVERITEIKKAIAGLQNQRFYEMFAESFVAREAKEIPEDVMNDWIDRLTVRTFNEELKNVFPYIYNLVDESELPVKELTIEDLVGESATSETQQSTQDSLPEVESYESMLNAMIGENSDILSQNEDEQQAAAQRLNDLVADVLPVGPDATNAIESLQGVIDDPELHQVFKELADVDPQFDIRPIIQDYLKIKDEENGTDLLSMVQFPDAEAQPAEVPAEEPQAEVPAEEPQAEVPAEEPTAEEGLEDGMAAPKNEMHEFIESMFDKESGNFPKGETGVLISVEKRFGEQAVPVAADYINRLRQVSESYRIKRLAGLI